MNNQVSQSTTRNDSRMYYRKICAHIAHYHFQFGMYVSLLQPLPCLPWLTIICRIAWLAWLAVQASYILYELVYSDYEKLGHFVGNALFLFNTLTTVVTFFELMCKEKHYHQLMRLENEVDQLLGKQTNINSIELKVWLKTFFHILIQTIYDVVHFGIATRSYKSPVFIYVLPLIIVERFRYAQISVIIERQNERARCLIVALKVLVRANQPKLKFTSDIWQPYTVWEYEHLNWIRLIQGRLCELHQSVNKCFGWSIIALLFSTFFTIVSNLFWCIEISKYKFQLGQFTYDALTMLRLFTMVAVLLASAERTKKNIMQISGLIFKLAKPLGNKAYNDLVSNLLLQCLHHGFILNIKGFFTLNISLLGNIIASSVTYLIILVQFLVSEEVDTKRTLGYKLMSNTTND